MGGTLQVPNLEMEEVRDDSVEDASQQETHPGSDNQEGAGGEQSTGGEEKITVPNLNLDTDESEAISQLLTTAGVTSRANVEALINNNQVFNNFFRTMETDPIAAFDAIRRVNPRLRDRIYEAVAEDYIRENDTSDDQDDRSRAGNRGRGSRDMVNPEVARLTETVTKLQQRLDTQDQQTQYQGLRKAFADRIDAYFNAGDLKSLPRVDKSSLKALLKESLAEDTDAFQRIQRGNFVDIPKHLQKVLDQFTADKKGDETADRKDRDTVAAGARKEVATGAGVDAITGRDTGARGTGDIWEDAVTELAGDLNRSKVASGKRGRK